MTDLLSFRLIWELEWTTLLVRLIWKLRKDDATYKIAPHPPGNVKLPFLQLSYSNPDNIWKTSDGNAWIYAQDTSIAAANNK
jgi:hypothetical protein